jgi:uncharacterized protein (DUF1330 family)
MKYYAVAQIDINDPSWIRAYVEHTTKLVERHGGRYLARTNARASMAKVVHRYQETQRRT